MSLVLVAAIALVSAACAPAGPRAMVVGADRCEHCHMTVADRRFGGQLVTTTGKTLVFDDAGCLASALQAEVVSDDHVRSIWVADFETAGQWLAAADAVYVRAAAFGTPMASGIVAVATRADAERLAGEVGGEILTWDVVGGLRQPGAEAPGLH